ncbi:acetyl-CoA C-acetyltransferase [Rhizobium sp. DKSPLA3]|uniref:Acetyl-CoA C-acetyltransferase n=1 Tax=Rhizobium quercicola TaxID=2901226 RepID=A0A9X1SYW9_9HYPH|nr:acetyl-CoA C-acetyltransferase [Rhizobium quercicola]MCD7107787.1 acetyl-CoA C-acetyltransferase [Rhizobium quercicola]
MSDAYIIDACRTPRGIGKAGKGALAHLHPSYLGSTVLRALARRNDLDTGEVDDVIWGTSAQVDKQSCDLGRMAALNAGYDVAASGVTLDRFCGSGITAVSLAAAQVRSGFEDCVVAGGSEMMSFTATAGLSPIVDAGNTDLRALHPQSQQGVCADAIATLEGITRADVDALAVESQRRAAAAIEDRRFDRSLIAVHNPDGSLALDREEFPRPGTTLETLAGLKTSFDKIRDIVADERTGETYGMLIQRRYPQIDRFDHVHHAGNSSGVVDGAAALLLASKAFAAKRRWKPRARIVATANMGDDPTLMLNAPVPAARKVLEKAGLTIADIDLFEINEAFAVVTEKFIRDLRLDREKVNVNGGAIALGHPIGATGAILIGTLLDELERQDKRYGLVTMCAAGGQAPAIIIERLGG